MRCRRHGGATWALAAVAFATAAGPLAADLPAAAPAAPSPVPAAATCATPLAPAATSAPARTVGVWCHEVELSYRIPFVGRFTFACVYCDDVIVQDGRLRRRQRAECETGLSGRSKDSAATRGDSASLFKSPMRGG